MIHTIEKNKYNTNLQAGLCDEISFVIAATADGSAQTPTLFMTKEGITEEYCTLI